MAKRILCILGKLKAGGVESIIYTYYQFLDKNKYQYDFVYEAASDFDIPDEILKLGARAYKIPNVSSPFKYIAAINRLIKKEGYSIVHSNLNSLSVFSMISARMCGVKWRILHNHTTSSPAERKRTIIKKILRPFNVLFANKYCACSELAARWMYGNRRVDRGEVRVLRNGVDCERFRFDPLKRAEMRRNLKIENKLVVGHIGRFVTTKNHLFIIDVFCELLDIRPDSHLVLVGDGELFEKVKDAVKSKGIEDKVTFTGVRHDIEDLYNVFDVFILPSLYEGLPVVGVEACASGLPVLLSDTITRECAITEAVDYLPINDTKIWAEKIAECEDIDRVALGLKVENSLFNIKNCVKEIEQLYDECVDS